MEKGQITLIIIVAIVILGGFIIFKSFSESSLAPSPTPTPTSTPTPSPSPCSNSNCASSLSTTKVCNSDKICKEDGSKMEFARSDGSCPSGSTIITSFNNLVIAEYMNYMEIGKCAPGCKETSTENIDVSRDNSCTTIKTKRTCAPN